MNQFIIKLLISVILLVTLVQAATDYSKLTPEQKKKYFSAIAGSLGGPKGVSKCTATSCGAGKKCSGSWGCVIVEGGKCIPAKDKCEGRYYCSSSGLCNGEGRGKLNDSCKGTLDCNNGLYCDGSANKCLKVDGKGPECFKPSDCVNRCSTGDCTCSGTTCVNR